LTARIELVLDPEAHGDGERADLIALAYLLRDLHAGKGICDADRHTDQALELSAEPGQVRCAAGEDDLADAQ